MGYGRYIGRVGALAVTLGVGMAMAGTPGIAYADPSEGASASSADSSSKSSSTSKSSEGSDAASKSSSKTKTSADTEAPSKPSSTKKSSVGTDAASTDGSAGTDSSASDRESSSGPADESTVDSDNPADADKADEVKGGDVDDGQDGDAAEPTDGASDEDAPPVAGDEDTPPADTTPAQDDSVQAPASHDSADPQVASRSARTHPSARLHTTDVDSTVTAADKVEVQPQTVSLDAVADVPARHSVAQSSAEAFTASATTLTSAVPVPSTPKQRPTLVKAVSDFVAAVLQPLLSPAKGSPIQMPILSALLSLVRNEFERIFAPPQGECGVPTNRRSADGSPNPVTDPTQQHVLVIGVDGTNLSRILADDYNQNFFDLMDTSTTAAASIVGHTTISNPSWTAILTGVWGERTGVINNVFTPWTYDKFPTVFNQLETLNPAIETMAVGDWDVINAIAGAGSVPADKNVFVPQIEGDTNWLETDDAVADKTVDAISGVNGTTPNFLFSYFVGVDENGHMYGGASPQYAAAIRNMDDNLGEIMDAVDAREAAHGRRLDRHRGDRPRSHGAEGLRSRLPITR